MNVVHLTDSPFFGGPERQMLGLAVSLPPSVRTKILCFRDHGSAAPFIHRLTLAGVPARMLGHANPRFVGMIADVAADLKAEQADVLVCHGYKADVVGWFAARRAGVPVLSVSRGWTSHTWKVRLNEAVGRVILRRMARVVCVSEGQAVKVRKARVPADRVRVIRNAIDASRFAGGDSGGRAALESMFPSRPDTIVVGIGRLSPEKGFDRLLSAARLVVPAFPKTGFVLIGEGPERSRLQEAIRESRLESHVMLAGFRSDVDQLLQGADILAQSSFTEGLPNVVLEACAAGIPVVATDVGGTSEVIQDGVNGYLVPPDDAPRLAERLLDLVGSAERRHAMGARGREVVGTRFSFGQQCREYESLFASLLAPSPQPGGRQRAAAQAAVTGTTE